MVCCGDQDSPAIKYPERMFLIMLFTCNEFSESTEESLDNRRWTGSSTYAEGINYSLKSRTNDG